MSVNDESEAHQLSNILLQIYDGSSVETVVGKWATMIAVCKWA